MKERIEFSPAISAQIVLAALDMNIRKKRATGVAAEAIVRTKGRFVVGKAARAKATRGKAQGGVRLRRKALPPVQAVPVSKVYRAYSDQKIPASRLEIIARIRSGLPGESVRLAQSYLGLQDKDMARILSREDKTIRGWRNKAILSSGASEQIFRLLKVYFSACSVLEDPDEALAWLKEPSEPLGGKTPLDLLSTAEGESLVNHELMQMEYAHPV